MSLQIIDIVGKFQVVW